MAGKPRFSFERDVEHSPRSTTDTSVGAHAVARDASGGVGGVDEVGGNMMTCSCGAVLVRIVAFA